MATDWFLVRGAVCPRCNRKKGVKVEATDTRYVWWCSCGTTWSREDTILALTTMYRAYYSRTKWSAKGVVVPVLGLGPFLPA